MSLSGDIISDMQLDASIEAIGEIAGNINLDGAGTTPTITASATVSPDPGIPACNVVKTGTDEYPNFTFNFSGLKGEQGSQGVPGQDGTDGADGVTPNITATGSVTNTTGTPSVTITKTGTDAAPNFDFAFVNIKGATGSAGPQGPQGVPGEQGADGVTPLISATASVTNTSGVPSVTVTKTGTDYTPNFDFAFENLKGDTGAQGAPGANGADGADGVTPIISATASVDDAVGIPNVVITRSGTDAAPNYDFAFHNLKGTQGNPGQGVPSGGTTGQVLAKQSGTDYDAAWESLVIPSTAAEISFDNTGTGMTATDVQDAVTELKSNLTQLPESGSNANGNYMKFPDGTLICTKTVTVSVSYSAWGSCYESNSIDLGALPMEFYSAPVVTLNLNNSSSSGWIVGCNPTTTTLGNTRCIRPNVGTSSQNITIGIIAIGRWKA